MQANILRTRILTPTHLICLSLEILWIHKLFIKKKSATPMWQVTVFIFFIDTALQTGLQAVQGEKTAESIKDHL